jgi:endogenous inhibitor of DNA gyrase (YacG/DUF329 family)
MQSNDTPLKGRVTLPCYECGADVQRYPSALKRGHRVFCDQVCAKKTFGERQKTAPAIRLSKKTQRSDLGCLEVTGKVGNHGYGTLMYNGKTELAHRAAWMMATGEMLTTEDFICHVCDNARCVETEDEGVYEVRGTAYPRRGHLFKATCAVNNTDMTDKGRHGRTSLNGTGIHAAKLTEDAVRRIRSERAAGATGVSLATKYGVSQAVISEVVTRRTWRHVE